MKVITPTVRRTRFAVALFTGLVLALSGNRTCSAQQVTRLGTRAGDPASRKLGDNSKTLEKSVRPAPEKEITIDRSAFRKAGQFRIPDAVFDVTETEHFKLMAAHGLDPSDVGELAERLWIDASSLYASFPAKFAARRMAIFLVDDDTTYGKIGQWYIGLLEKAGAAEAARYVRTTWQKAAASALFLPESLADENKIFASARVFRVTDQAAAPPGGGNARSKTEKSRVWIPFRVHFLSNDLLDIQTGGLSSFGVKGCYALSTGYAYFKEITLAGAAETSIVSVETVDTAKSTGGFGADARTWPEQLRRRVRKEGLKPTLAMLYEMNDNNSDAECNVLAYSFVGFLLSSPERAAGWSRLVEDIALAGTVPPPEKLAPLLGFPDGAALEKEWTRYISGKDNK